METFKSRTEKANLERQYRSAASVVGGFAYGLSLGEPGAIRLLWCTGDPGFLKTLHPDDAPALEEHFQALAGGRPDDRELRFLSPEAGVLWWKLQARPFRSAGEPGILVFGLATDETRQTSVRRELEVSAAAREKELSSLLEISHTLASTLKLEPLLGLILTGLKELVDYTGAAILQPDGDHLVLLDYRGPMPRDQAMQLRIPISRSPGYEKLISERVPVIISDVLKETVGTNNFQRSVRQFLPFFGYAFSVLLTPLVVKDRLIGVLRLDHRDRGHFVDRHASLALAVANHAAIALENAQLYEQASQLAKLEERQRIARELHDSVSQALYGIRLGAQTALELQTLDPAKTADSLKYVRDLADSGLQEMRALLFELRPEAIAVEGLISGLRKMATSLEVRHGLLVRQDLWVEPEIDLESKDALYRIAQEALHNVVKHAKARQVQIRLRREEASITLEILDDGKGFSLSETSPDRMGLVSMLQRARKLGGALDIETAPGEGTRLHVTLPIHA